MNRSPPSCFSFIAAWDVMVRARRKMRRRKMGSRESGVGSREKDLATKLEARSSKLGKKRKNRKTKSPFCLLRGKILQETLGFGISNNEFIFSFYPRPKTQDPRPIFSFSLLPFYLFYRQTPPASRARRFANIDAPGVFPYDPFEHKRSNVL